MSESRLRVVFHIGLHKTATTWLQRELWPRWPGIRYLGKPWRQGCGSLPEALRRHTDETCLISSESFSGSLTSVYLNDRPWLERFHERTARLARDYADITPQGVILGLRRHDGWILSIYKHYLKYGGWLSQQRFLGVDDGDRPPLFHEDDLSFQPRIEGIRQHLGVEPFVFFTEELKDNPDGLLADIACYIGIAPMTGPLPVARRHNEGLGRREAALIHRLNARRAARRGTTAEGRLPEIDKRPFKYVRALSRARLLPRGAELQLDPDTRERLLTRYRDDLDYAVAAARRLRPGFRPPQAIGAVLGAD